MADPGRDSVPPSGEAVDLTGGTDSSSNLFPPLGKATWFSDETVSHLASADSDDSTKSPNDSPALAYGLAYIAKGWRIFPCHSIERGVCTCSKGKTCSSPGKHPRTNNGVHEATTDEGTVRLWVQTWGERMNWALACGAESGVFVVDIDQRHNGFASLEEFEANRSEGPLPATLKALTGGSGRHLFFAYPDDDQPVGNRNGWLPGVDVKSDGGYVVLPPSAHASGGSYVWLDDFQSIDPALPPWDLVESIRDRESSTNGKPQLPSPDDILAGVPMGERDDVLFRWACQLRRKLDDNRKAIETLVLQAARSCTPPFPEDEALKKVDQAFKQNHTDAEVIWDYLGIHPFNDDGNASRLVDRFKDEIRYVPATKTWHVWNGAYWVPDPGANMVLGRARELTAILTAEAEFTTDERERSAVLRFAKESGNNTRMVAAVKVAQTDPLIVRDADAFDRQPHLLNCLNGVVDLRTGDLLPHNPDLMLSKIVPHSYVKDAPPPVRWLSVVERLVRSPEDAALVHRFTGYALTGYTREDKALFIKGPPRNGKSTVVKAVHMILGDGYCAVAHEDLLAAARNKHDDMKAHIIGRRAVITAETDGDQRLDAKLFKRLTGGDGINARQLYAQSHDYKPTWKLMIATNEMMSSTKRDPAVTERLLIIEAADTLPVEQRDPFLDDALAAEAEAILSWMVRQAVAWYRDIRESNDDPSRATTGLPITASSRAAASEYEDDSDPLADWIAESCTVGEGGRVSSSDAWRSYDNWAEFKRLTVRLKKQQFFTQLRLHPGVRQPDHRKWFDGIAVENFALSFEAAAKAMENQMKEMDK